MTSDNRTGTLTAAGKRYLKARYLLSEVRHEAPDRVGSQCEYDFWARRFHSAERRMDAARKGLWSIDRRARRRQGAAS